MKTLRQVLQEIKDLESKTLTYLQAIGYKSDLASKKYKHLIKSCTSLSIVLLHFHQFSHSLTLLSKALKTDLKMYFEGDSSDRTWTGRILIYCNLSYLLLRNNESRSALKFLYDSETMLTEMRSLGKPTNDLRFSHSILIFLSLLNLKRYKQSEKYLSNSIHFFSLVSPRYDVISCKSIFFLLEFSRVVLEHCSKQDFITVQEGVKEALISESPNKDTKGLVRKFKSSGMETGLELLSSGTFADCMFLVVFFPFVAEETPQISYEELKKPSKFEVLQVIKNNLKRGEDCYSVLMDNALEEVKEGY